MLLNHLVMKPDLQIDEMVYFLWDSFQVEVSYSAVQRMLKRVKWWKKNVYSSPLFH